MVVRHMFENVAAQDQVEVRVVERKGSQICFNLRSSWLDVNRHIATHRSPHSISQERLRGDMQYSRVRAEQHLPVEIQPQEPMTRK